MSTPLAGPRRSSIGLRPPGPDTTTLFAFVVAYAVDVTATARGAKPPNRGLSLYGEEWMAQAAMDLHDFCGKLGNALCALEGKVAGLKRTHADASDLARTGVFADAQRMLLAPRHHVRETGRLPRVTLNEREVAPTARLNAAFVQYETASNSSHEVRRAGVMVATQMAREIRLSLGVDPVVLRSDEIASH